VLNRIDRRLLVARWFAVALQILADAIYYTAYRTPNTVPTLGLLARFGLVAALLFAGAVRLRT
jgi:hypothetical protein